MNVVESLDPRRNTVIVESMLLRDESLSFVKDVSRFGSTRRFRFRQDILPVYVLHHLQAEAESLRPWRSVLTWCRDFARGFKVERFPMPILTLPDEPEACEAFLARTIDEVRGSDMHRVLVNLNRLKQTLSPAAEHADVIVQLIESALDDVNATLEAAGEVVVRVSEPELAVARAPRAAPRQPEAAVPFDEPTPASHVAPHLESAIAARDRLLREEGWHSSAEVSHLVRARAPESNPSEFAKRLRKEGRLFGVRLGKEYRHPAFQFDATTGALNPAMARLIPQLPTTDGNWAAAFWLFHPNYWLRGRRPADVFVADPEAVITAAEKDFHDGHAGA